MERTAIRLTQPCLTGCMLALFFLLLCAPTARGGDQVFEQPVWTGEECGNCNLYWHGPDDTCYGQLPTWYAGADVLVLRRDIDNLDDRAFAFDAAQGPLLGSKNFNDEYDAGLRVTIGYAINDWYRLEGVYFGSFFFSDVMSLRTPGANDLTFIYGDTGSFASVRYSSTLDNAELNLRSRVAMPPGPIQFNLLFGGRYMKLDERFVYASDGATVSQANTNTSNDLLGLQIGLQAQWRTHPRAWLDYDLKGAVLTNRATQTTTSNAFAGAMTATDDVTAFLVDMSLIFNYQLTPSVSMRFGYNAVWLDGVALGVQNVEPNLNLFRFGPAKVIHSGSVVYHGPSFGIIFVR